MYISVCVQELHTQHSHYERWLIVHQIVLIQQPSSKLVQHMPEAFQFFIFELPLFAHLVDHYS